MKKQTTVFILLLTMVLAVSSIGVNAAPAFPNRPVEAVVAFSAGGGADLIFRAAAQYFPKYANNQPMLVKNVPGAAGVPGIVDFSRAKPDGLTILHWNVAHVIKTHMSKVPFSATSFEPVIQLVADNNYLLVKADSPYKTLGDLIEAAKKNPGKITIGNGGPGGGHHMAALLLEDHTGADFLHVPYQGGGPAITGLLAGQIDASMNIAPEGLNNVEAGQLRILAIFSDGKYEKIPTAPTAKEQGFNLVIPQWRGVVVPQGTPKATIKQLHDIYLKILRDPEFVKKMSEMGVVISYKNSDDFGKYLKEEDLKYEKLIKSKKLGDRY